MNKKLALLIVGCFVGLAANAQNSDDEYAVCDTATVEEISVAQQYFLDRGKKYPLENVEVDMTNENYKKIVKDASKVLKIDPNDVDGLYYRGWAYYYLHNYTAAIGDFYTMYVNQTGSSSYYYMNCDAFVNILSYCTGMVPEFAMEFFKARLKELDKKYVREELTANDITSLVLNNISGYNNEVKSVGYQCLAVASITLGRHKEALESYLPEVLKYVDTDEEKIGVMNWMANCCIRLEMPEKALAILNSAQQEYGATDADVLQNRIISLRNMGKTDEAIALLENYLIDNPDDYSQIESLSIILTRLGKTEEVIARNDTAIKRFETYLEKYVHDGWIIDGLASLHMRRGLAYTAQGYDARAKLDYEWILEKAKESGCTLHCYAYLGRIDEIKEVLEDEHVEAVYRASLYAAAGLYDEAFKHLPKAFELQQFAPSAIRWDINLYMLMDDPRYDAAVARFNPER